MLEVRDLTVTIGTEDGAFEAVSEVSLSLAPGEILGLVGESGCGKSITSLAVMGLLPPQARVSRGGVFLDGEEITRLPPHRRLGQGSGRIAMIFQEPMTSLNPVMRVGEQIAEAIRVRETVSERETRARAVELLDMVRIPDPARRIDNYPHEMSGGMRQRAMIAIALACRPSVLIADEPTTALDVTVQTQILGLIRDLCDSLSVAVLYITHDLGTVAALADGVCVMYRGRIVERAPVADLFHRPTHPYTVGLMACLPRIGERPETLETIPGSAPPLGPRVSGCGFAPRCERAQLDCHDDPLPWFDTGRDHVALCRYPMVEREP